eukprot:scaffold21463_cov52-Attheya_sp.AAC.1
MPVAHSFQVGTDQTRSSGTNSIATWSRGGIRSSFWSAASSTSSLSAGLWDSPEGTSLLNRGSFLDKTAGAVQAAYWSQFADDTYTGAKPRRQEQKKQLLASTDDKVALTVEAGADSQSQKQTIRQKPFAPMEALFPALRVRIMLDSLAKNLATVQTISSNTNESTKNAVDDRISVLKQMDATLADTALTGKAIRASLNTYTANLRFSESYVVTAPEAERRRYIRQNDGLPDVKAVIIADLDLRDLRRNELLTLVDDLRAEVRYQLRLFSEASNNDSSSGSMDEVQRLVDDTQHVCNEWFDFIDPKDIKDAMVELQK